jgi:hypothetical protein
VGDQVGQNIIKYAKNNGFDLPFNGPIQVGKYIGTVLILIGPLKVFIITNIT